MNLVSFSRRGSPPVMQRQMPPSPVRPSMPLLMFKVTQRDRLIKRRLRDAPRPSLGPPWRIGGERVKGVATQRRREKSKNSPRRKHPLTYIHRNLPLLGSPCSARASRVQRDLRSYRCSHERRLSRGLIKSDIYSGTVAKSHGGERDLEGWRRWPFLSLSYWMI